MPGRDRQGDQGPHRVADDVSGADAVVVQQPQGVLDVFGGCQGSYRLGARAVAVSPPMVEDPAEPGQRGRLGERHHRVGEQCPVDQQHRVTVTGYPVGQCDALDLHAFKGDKTADQDQKREAYESDITGTRMDG
jgi:hypothetical protein